MAAYLLQFPDGEFVCPESIVSSPLAAFAQRFTESESRNPIWAAAGCRRLRIEGGPDCYSPESLLECPEFVGNVAA